MLLQEAATLAFLRVLSRAVPRGRSFFRENKTLSWLQSQGGFLHWKDFFLNTIYTEGADCQRDNWETPGENVSLLIDNGFLLPSPPPSERKKKKKKHAKKFFLMQRKRQKKRATKWAWDETYNAQGPKEIRWEVDGKHGPVGPTGVILMIAPLFREWLLWLKRKR